MKLICIISTSIVLFSTSLTYSQQIDGGNGHAIILDKYGKVFTVGRNNYGQLGVGSFESGSTTQQVKGLPKIKKISRGYDHSMAIDQKGNLWSWGRNNYGQLGTNLPLDYNKPQKIQSISGLIEIEGGHWHSVAVKKDSTVWAWGHNFYGELGNGNREHSAFPTPVILENGDQLSGIVKIVSVGYFTLALDSEGFVYSWGGNSSGCLGHRDRKHQTYAAKVEGLSKIKSIAVGWHHAVALNEDGEILVWGSVPSADRDYTKISKFEGVPKMKKIACGSWHSLAIDENNEVWGWGENNYGMLGTGDTRSTTYPIKLKLPKGICTIAGGCFQSFAIDSEGEIWTMGGNGDGQQGQNNLEGLTLPKKMDLNTEKKSASIHSGMSRIVKIGSVILILSVLINIALVYRIRSVIKR